MQSLLERVIAMAELAIAREAMKVFIVFLAVIFIIIRFRNLFPYILLRNHFEIILVIL